EIGFFFGPGNLGAGFGGHSDTVVVGVNLVIGEEAFISYRVPARIGVQVDVPVGFHPTPDFPCGGIVVVISGANEPVIGNTQDLIVHSLEHIGIAGSQFHGLDAFLNGRLLHFLAVLIGAGEVADIITVQALEPRHDIGGDVFVGVPDVGFAVWVGNRRCQVVGVHRTVSSKSTSAVCSA